MVRPNGRAPLWIDLYRRPRRPNSTLLQSALLLLTTKDIQLFRS